MCNTPGWPPCPHGWEREEGRWTLLGPPSGSPPLLNSMSTQTLTTLPTFIVSKLEVVVEGGEEVIGELPVEVVQVLRTVPAALQAEREVVRHRACEVWVPEKEKVSG